MSESLTAGVIAPPRRGRGRARELPPAAPSRAWRAVGPLGLLAAASRRPVIFLAALTLVALALRLPHLASRAFWFDEVYQVHMADGHDLAEVMARIRVEDRNPPGAHLVVRLARQIDRGEAMTRLPSLLAGLACVPLAWLFGRLTLGRRPAALLALLFAVSPAMVFYSREARAYAGGVALLLGLLCAARLFLARPSAGRVLLLAVAGAACVLWQYAAAVAVAAVLLGLLAAVPPAGPRRRAFLVGWCAAGAACAAVLGGTVIAFMLPQMRLHGTGTADKPFAAMFFDPLSWESASTFLSRKPLEFIEFLAAGGKLGPRWQWLVGGVAALAAAGYCIRARTSRRKRPFPAAAALGVAMFLAMAAAGYHPFGGTRHCLPLMPLAAVLLADGLGRLARRARPLADLAVLGLLAVAVQGNLHAVPAKHIHDIREVLAELRQAAGPDDPVLVHGPGAAVVFRYYHDREPFLSRVTYAAPYAGVTEADVPAFEESLAAVGAGRFWVVEFPDETAAESPEAARLLAARARELRRIEGTRIRATLWELKESRP